jgi:MYND finger
MDLQELVRAFNRLPRSPKTPSGLDSHWHIAIRHVPLSPPGDLLHLVHPGSQYTHVDGPAQILSVVSAESRADIVLPMLLRSFVNNMGEIDPHVTPRRPGSWGTRDKELAMALEEKLKAVGVCAELCMIKVGDEKDMAIEEEVWARVFDKVKLMVGPKCNQCRNPPSGDEKIQVCSRCKTAQYCSRDCQKADWKEHKAVCKYLAKDPSIDPLDYYQNFAPHFPEAQELAHEIGLSLPRQGGNSHGLRYDGPCCRLAMSSWGMTNNLLLF